MNVQELIGDFSLNLSKKMLDDLNFEKNYCSSTASIYFALVMIHIGAKGKSADELSSLLGLNYSLLLKTLSDSSETKKILENIGNVYKICCESSEIHNKIFFDCQLNQNYIDLLQDFFMIELEKISFQNKESSCNSINSWINKKTHGRLDGVVEESNIDSSTIFMLINTIYFKSNWKEKFDTTLTGRGAFFVNPQKNIIVPMMHKTGSHLFYLNQSKQFSVLIKPYCHSGVVGVFMLPDKESNLQKFLFDFTIKELKECIRLAREVEVDVILPKFKLKQRFSLKNILIKIGVAEIFNRNCDLSNMSDEHVYVSDVIHSANVEINEEGVVASAATVVIGNVMCFKPPKNEFIANRPFLFMIYDIKNEFPIFVNAIINPE